MILQVMLWWLFLKKREQNPVKKKIRQISFFSEKLRYFKKVGAASGCLAE